MMTLLLPILSTVIVLWSSLRWYWFRIGDGTDESLSAVALLTAILFIVLSKLEQTDRKIPKEQKTNWLLPALSTALYTVLLPFTSKPVLGILMVLLVASVAKALGALTKEKMMATAAMLLLALPLTASFNFYCQWPLQLFIAKGAAAILELYGYPLEVQGASIFFEGKPIVIDAACSGLHFIWFSLYFGILIAYLKALLALKVALISTHS